MGGCVVGALLAANIADSLGRKNSVLLLAPITFLSFIGMAFVTKIWYLSALRFVVGIVEGSLYTILPLYVGEIVDAEIRGFATSLLSILYFVGCLFINLIGPFMTIFYSSFVISLFSAIHFIIFIFMPESPYYCVKFAKYKEAENSLRKLKGYDNVKKEIDYLKEVITNETKMVSETKLTNLVTVPSNRKACLIFFILVWTSKITGKYPIMFFTTNIFIESGSTIDPTLSVIVYGIVEVIVITAGGIISDKLGKRPLMLVSGFGSTLTVFSLGIYFYLKESRANILSQLNWLPITSLILFNIFYSIGLGYGYISYLSELFPMNVKSKATCLAEILNVLLGIAISQFFQITYVSFGMSTPFLSFGIICGFSMILMCKILPETKGKSLEEVQHLLMKSSEKKSTK